MNYKFPEINHIDDVIPHIENRTEFRVMVKDWYTVIRYMVSLEDTFSLVCDIAYDGVLSLVSDESQHNMKIRRECRGLIFDTETGALISRPYHKFFNAGEKDETQLGKINLYEPHVVLEKLDGSMIRPIPTKDGFLLGTKAGITDTAMNAEVFIADKPHYAQFIHKCIQKGTTPIFEWCSRKNRIVIDYPEDQLILTGIRYNDIGSYVSYKTMKQYAEAWEIPVVKAIDCLSVQNVELFVKQVREWDDGEGVVLRFDNGHMVKVKADDYVLRHRSMDQLSQEKNVIQIIVNDSVDDLIPLLTPEDANRLKAFQSAFWVGVENAGTNIHDIYRALDWGQDQKEFAMSVMKGMPKHLQNFMFGLRRGVPVKTLLVDQITKSLNTQTKIHNSRWMWGNLDWNT